jgi:hypothetical protein
MQNELTNVAQEKFLKNRHLAFNIRTKLRQNLSGSPVALRILEELTDEQLVAKSLTHHVLKTMPLEAVMARQESLEGF